MDRNGNGFYRYLHYRFSAKSDAKITAGIIFRQFIGTGIWQLMNEERFGERLTLPEKEAWY